MPEIVLMGDPRVAEVPVAENDELLVDARTIADLAWDGRREDPEGAYAHLRRGLTDRLLEAASLLPDDYRLLLVEGYRPYELQEQYFRDYHQELRELDPSLDDDSRYRLASRYVSPPVVAPHVSGAAIDLTLSDASGREVDMGTAMNATPEESDGGCYFGAESISVEGRHNRQVLGSVLSRSGLVNYPTEWWHWSFGDRYWALTTQQPAAIYGPVRNGTRVAPDSRPHRSAVGDRTLKRQGDGAPALDGSALVARDNVGHRSE